MENLSFLVETNLRIEKLRIALQTRNTHLRKQGRRDATTIGLEERLRELESYLDSVIAEKLETHPAYDWFSKVKGVGSENISKVIGLINIEKAPHISSLWKFAGMSVENGKAPRPQKGKKLSYNKTLRTMVWRLGTSLLRAKGKFYQYYLKEKEKYYTRFRNANYKIVPASELPKDEKGRRYEPEGVISEGHLDNMARRKMMKLFLASLWLVWRQGAGLPITKPYAIDKLGHNHYLDPWEFTDR